MGKHEGPNNVPWREGRIIAVRLAHHFVGTPYVWGGDDPEGGFDCSGLVVELLTSVSLMKRGDDMAARTMWEEFEDCRVRFPASGVLVFYGSHSAPKRVSHVEICISAHLAIGASGGGSKTRTVEDAVTQNAYVKVRPIARDRPVVGYADPFKRLPI